MAKLTTEEWNTLYKIAEFTGLDSWFSLKEKDNGDVVIYDLDNEKEIELEDGLLDFSEGLVDDDIYELGLEKEWNLICDKFMDGIFKVKIENKD